MPAPDARTTASGTRWSPLPSTLLEGSASHLAVKPGGAGKGPRTLPWPRAGPLPNPYSEPP
ncbi:hypothetical protein GCM10010177_14860 [Actinomadura citrea]|nr:hypothetical protein GCM10010177_14860 [Actinomadura citrea]